MPIYEYKCSDCEHELEKLQKMNDAPLTDCPECGKPALKKMISAAGFRLTGSGWYETDFKNNSKNNDKKDSKSSSNKNESATDTGSKTDSKKGSESGTGCTNKAAACGGGGCAATSD